MENTKPRPYSSTILYTLGRQFYLTDIVVCYLIVAERYSSCISAINIDYIDWLLLCLKKEKLHTLRQEYYIKQFASHATTDGTCSTY